MFWKFAATPSEPKPGSSCGLSAQAIFSLASSNRTVFVCLERTTEAVDLSITPFTCDIVGLPSLHRGYRVDSLGVVRIVDFAYHTTAHTPSARCPSDVPIPVSERGFSSCALSEVSCRTQMRSRCPHEQLRFFGGEGPLFTSTTEVSVAAELGNFIGTLGVHWVLTSRGAGRALSAFGQSRGHPTLMVLYEDREANEFFMTF
ncbi:hypothetical protein C8Q76DRAFT_802549 [Earliella scabrosa]|nr:hypothetical protein C8Q76DRAFT_802549 [Earliella scabrosa]